ncbi:flagellar hook-associated protein FlgK [Actimicrobium antarcticum]|uniref:Flagellar hook-associated protein 1 n=1 Tax=Actimicrobium antarcticum TaxID=1051899 RepID=A0ABP7SQF6_9BURK
MGNILSVGQSGLLAAQLGVTTTGHNIANAATPGYSRQIVVQTSAGGQSSGNGFVGQGTNVTAIQRVYDSYTANRVNASQTGKAGFDAYASQISQINNLLADSTTGLSPVLGDFFNNVQNLSANPGSSVQRQTLLSSADSLVARFQSLDGELSRISEGVNQQVIGTVSTINGYAKQIATLNDAIEKATSAAEGAPPNDLLDQRDLIVSELSKQVKVSVDNQPGSGYNVSFGSGQPLVIGTATYALQVVTSTTDQTKLEVGYQSGGVVLRLPDSAISGGTLGGLLDFRSTTLDPARNELGRVAVGLATAFNDQSKLGVDKNGQPGKDFFKIPGPQVSPSNTNTGNDVISATISNASSLTTSDYSIGFDGTNYNITRLADKKVVSTGAFPTAAIDGITFSKTAGSPPVALIAGDSFLVQPTLNGASGIKVALTNNSEIAAAAPIVTGAPAANGGNGTISAGTVDKSYLATPLASSVTLTYDSVTKLFTTSSSAPGFVSSTIAYTSGSNIVLGGATFQIAGAPATGDKFTIGPNTTGTGDGRNAVALGALQTARTLDNGTTSFSGAFGQLVNTIGNKTREVTANAAAEGTLLANAKAIQQSQSGVNLDEEASNLLRYQQAYQAAGKIMQTASTLFDVLLSLGR